MNTCFYTPLLDAYLDGELSQEKSAELKAHLSACPACREYIEDMLVLREAFADMKYVAVPEGFTDSVMAAVYWDIAQSQSSSPCADHHMNGHNINKNSNHNHDTSNDIMTDTETSLNSKIAQEWELSPIRDTADYLQNDITNDITDEIDREIAKSLDSRIIRGTEVTPEHKTASHRPGRSIDIQSHPRYTAQQHTTGNNKQHWQKIISSLAACFVLIVTLWVVWPAGGDSSITVSSGQGAVNQNNSEEGFFAKVREAAGGSSGSTEDIADMAGTEYVIENEKDICDEIFSMDGISPEIHSPAESNPERNKEKTFTTSASSDSSAAVSGGVSVQSENQSTASSKNASRSDNNVSSSGSNPNNSTAISGNAAEPENHAAISDNNTVKSDSNTSTSGGNDVTSDDNASVSAVPTPFAWREHENTDSNDGTAALEEPDLELEPWENDHSVWQSDSELEAELEYDTPADHTYHDSGGKLSSYAGKTVPNLPPPDTLTSGQVEEGYLSENETPETVSYPYEAGAEHSSVSSAGTSGTDKTEVTEDSSEYVTNTEYQEINPEGLVLMASQTGDFFDRFTPEEENGNRRIYILSSEDYLKLVRAFPELDLPDLSVSEYNAEWIRITLLSSQLPPPALR